MILQSFSSILAYFMVIFMQNSLFYSILGPFSALYYTFLRFQASYSPGLPPALPLAKSSKMPAILSKMQHFKGGFVISIPTWE